MPGQMDEATAIFERLARDVSPDTHVNEMGQYRLPARRAASRPTESSETRNWTITRLLSRVA
jgi:hypothetical protein